MKLAALFIIGFSLATIFVLFAKGAWIALIEKEPSDALTYLFTSVVSLVLLILLAVSNV